MRILIAPDKFKGTLSAKEAATAIAQGVRRAAEERGIAVEIEECPVADGGEGFLDCVHMAFNVEPEFIDVSGPTLPESVTGRVLSVPPRTLLDIRPRFSPSLEYKLSCSPRAKSHFEKRFERGSVPCDAYIESADAVGMKHVLPHQLNPERADSMGLGQLIDHALQLNACKLFIGLGGSATVDGGTGAVEWLGIRFRDGKGQNAGGSASTLGEIRSITPLPAEHAARNAEIIVACDVSNPLLGANGAARVFGPQKGATPEQVERLEEGLENLVKVCRDCDIPCDPDQPGAGAAGGLGFGLATFLGAKLVPGAPFILDLLKFDERVARADLVITGEGRLDSQTTSGKAAAEVARRAARAGKRCAAIVGDTEGTTAQMRSQLASAGLHFQSITSAAETAGTPAAAMADSKRWLQEAAYRAAGALLGTN